MGVFPFSTSRVPTACFPSQQECSYPGLIILSYLCLFWLRLRRAVTAFRLESSSMETPFMPLEWYHIVTLALVSWCTEIWSPCPYRVIRFPLRQACNTHRCAFSCCRCATILPFNRVWRLLSLYVHVYLFWVREILGLPSSAWSTALRQSLRPRPFL